MFLALAAFASCARNLSVAASPRCAFALNLPPRPPKNPFDKTRAMPQIGARMKTKLLTVICVLAVGLGSTSPALASDDSGSLELAADVVVVRPACFLATVIGSALFVVSLPVAATSRSVKKAARTLVVRPAKATFTRPLGDMESLMY